MRLADHVLSANRIAALGDVAQFGLAPELGSSAVVQSHGANLFGN